LFVHGLQHVEAGINLAQGRGIRLAMRTERDGPALVLQRIHRPVVLRRARAVNAPQHPDDAGGRAVCLHPGWQLALPLGAGKEIFLPLVAGCPRAADSKHRIPPIEHGKLGVALLRQRKFQHPGFAGNVQPNARIQGVGIGKGHVAIRGGRESPNARKLPHRGTQARGFLHVAHQPPGQIHGHQRVAEHISLDSQVERGPRSQRRLGAGGLGCRFGFSPRQQHHSQQAGPCPAGKNAPRGFSPHRPHPEWMRSTKGDSGHGVTGRTSVHVSCRAARPGQACPVRADSAVLVPPDGYGR